MILQPRTRQQLSQDLAQAHTAGQPIAGVDLRYLREIVEYSPPDMTVTVESGLTLDELQQSLAPNRQWLPIDPPDGAATINDLLAGDLSGSRRLGYGTIREHLLGLTVVLADGRVFKNGGKVVKNVAGYDLCKLFVGHRNTLGIVVDATFKLRPVPEDETVLRFSGPTLREAAARMEEILQSALRPVLLDLHNLEPGADAWLVVGFAGSAEEVQWQREQLRPGGEAVPLPLKYQASFWAPNSPPSHRSVLPSQLVSTIEMIAPSKFIAQAGNGVIYYRGGATVSEAPVPLKLMRQIKELFDPKQILPPLPW